MRRSASARPGWRSTATISPWLRHQRGEVGGLAAGRGAQVEHALAGLRASSTLRDRHRGARLRHQQAVVPLGRAEDVERRVEDQRLAVERVRHGQALGERLGRSILSVLARRTASAGSLSAAISARASGAPSASNHSCGDPLGVRVRERGLRRAWRSGRACDDRARFARGAAQDGVDEAGAARRVALGQLDRLAHGGVRGHAVQKGQLEDAEPQRGQHRRVELVAANGRRARRSRGRAWPRAGRCRRLSCVASARSRASSRQRRASPCSARSAQASCSNTRRTTAYAHARAGATGAGSAPRWSVVFLHASLYASACWLVVSIGCRGARSAPAAARSRAAPHTEVQFPVRSSRLKVGCLQPFLSMLVRSSKNRPASINFFR